MNERQVTLDFVEGETDVTLGETFRYFTVPCDMTIIYVCASPSVADAALTLDINDDGTGVITALACGVVAVPGTWKSTHMGGTNTPVQVAAGSVLSFDANAATASTRIAIQIVALVGEKFS